MTEYKDTLNLPKTDFPMKASLATREPAFLEKWQSKNLYQSIRQSRAGCEHFILHDGPPYANGSLHCGHALNKILKDIIVKSKTLSGFDAPYVPGWDCHGLPIELNVEKKHGKAGHKLSHQEFRQKCRDYAATQIDLQREQFKRLGVFADWENPYATMQYSYEANIIRALGEIIANGHLEQGVKPVYWCLDCASSLAEAEVEYADKTSPSIDVAFSVVDNTLFQSALNHSDNKTISFVIWTTTPWTLPANQAVALNESLEYALVDCPSKNSAFIIACDLVENVMNRYDIEDYSVCKTYTGKELEGIKLSHPLFDREVPVVLGEHVTLEAGTGCVHTAPAHGPDDYKLGLKYSLPIENPVMGNGVFSEATPLFAGIHVKKADGVIIEKLEEKNVLVASSKLSHSYPHCWRHKTPVIFRATPQWFIAMDKNNLREKALAGIENTAFTPDWGKERIAGMVEGRPDWCISRQRYWGTPIPLFVHKESGELHPDTAELIEKVALLVEEQGIDAWFELEKETLLGEESDSFDKITDTLDVWFDAGVSHYAVLKKRKELSWPADLYLEGSDQHRGWFNSSLMTSTALYEKPSYKHVLTHGFTVDEKGIKLSKSKGNYIAPEKIINQSGADILRLWAASADYKGEVHLSNEIIKRLSDSYRRIRNTCRFLLANLFDFDAEKHLIDKSQLVLLDKWAIKTASNYQDEIKQAFNHYDFHVVVQKIQHFCTVEMGSFYLDVIKDRQYTTPTNSTARRSCQTAIYHILEMLSRWMAPILSFTSEEVWSHMQGDRDESVFLSHWYDDYPVIDDVNLGQWQLIQRVRDEVNKAIEAKRKAGVLGSALEADVTLYASDKNMEALRLVGDDLKFIFITSSASVSSFNERESHAEPSDMEGLHIKIKASEDKKCERCWHRVESVGCNAEHEGLCHRCVGNISGRDEKRRFA